MPGPRWSGGAGAVRGSCWLGRSVVAEPSADVAASVPVPLDHRELVRGDDESLVVHGAVGDAVGAGTLLESAPLRAVVQRVGDGRRALGSRGRHRGSVAGSYRRSDHGPVRPRWSCDARGRLLRAYEPARQVSRGSSNASASHGPRSSTSGANDTPTSLSPSRPSPTASSGTGKTSRGGRGRPGGTSRPNGPERRCGSGIQTTPRVACNCSTN